MAVKNWLPKPIDGKETGKMEEALKAVDIRDTLNAYNGNVSNKTTSFFKPEANINRWSKHKPIVVNKAPEYIRFIKFDDEIWDNQPGEAPTEYIGLTPNTQPDKLAIVWNGCSEEDWFKYELPTGGQSSPLRMGDFRGYRADATSPFKSFTSDTSSIGGEGAEVNFELVMRYHLNDELAEADGGMLSLSDMAVFKDEEVYTFVAIAKYTHRTTKDVTYKAYEGSSTSTASWSTLNSTVNIGNINNTNHGTYEFAAALRDSKGNFFKLPFPKVKVEADILHYNDYIEIANTSAVKGSNGEARLSLTIHAGIQTSAGSWTYPLYIAGKNDSMMQGPFGSGSLTLEKGKSGTLTIVVNKNTTSWSTVQSILDSNEEVYLNYLGVFEGAVLTTVTN